MKLHKVKHMLIHTCVPIPEEAFHDIRKMRGVFDGVLARYPDSLCLQQGLSPFDGSKLMFINSPYGRNDY